jgi:hypothetical protein
MTVIINGTDNSASTPAVTGTDGDTGMFYPAANTVALSTGGSERMRVDSSGNVGIGTSPSYRLHVSGSNASHIIQYNNNAGSGRSQIAFQDTATTFAPSLGSIGDAIGVYTAGNERMRIDSSGNVGNMAAGFSSGSNNWIITSGNATIKLSGAFNSTTAAEFHNNFGLVGSITTSSSTTAYNTSSDYRLKHDIQPMTGALTKVAQLKPVTYKWNADDSQSQGFIAHELQEVVPECVTGEKDAVDADGNPQYQGIDTSFLVATLTAAIQELKAINDAQAQRIETLEAKVAALEGAE